MTTCIVSLQWQFFHVHTEHFRSDVVPECAVALEMRFVEKLVDGGGVRKLRVPFSELNDIHGLISGHRGFDIEKLAALRFSGINDCSQGVMESAYSRTSNRLKRLNV